MDSVRARRSRRRTLAVACVAAAMGATAFAFATARQPMPAEGGLLFLDISDAATPADIEHPTLDGAIPDIDPPMFPEAQPEPPPPVPNTPR